MQKNISMPRIYIVLGVLALLGLGVWLGHHAENSEVSLGVISAQAQPMAELETTADVAEQVAPSVVNVNTTRMVSQTSPFANDPFFNQFFGQPQEREATNLGSGVIISRDGYILTNNHVVAQADEVRITTTNGMDYLAEVIGTDEASDLALLKVDADDLTPLPIGNSDELRVGEVVLAIGNPFGLDGTVTMGIVSAKGRGIGLVDYEDFIQTDAAINPGNSGGALVNLRGELVGINSAILSRSGGSQGVGFAIPSNMATVVMENLREHGRVLRGYLGVRLQDLDPTLARGMGLDDDQQGVVVTLVEENSAADVGGMKAGDIIVAVDGRPADSMRELRTMVGLTAPGTEVEFEVFRDGKRRDLDIELGTRPGDDTVIPASDEQDAGHGAPFEGVAVQDANPRLNQQMRLAPDSQGPVVVNVKPHTPAARGGLRVGDIILQVDQQPVEDTDGLRNAVKLAMRDEPDRPVVLLVQRGEISLYVAVDPSGK